MQQEAPGTKGVGSLLNMDTFAVLRQLRTKMTSGDITQEQYDAERARILNKKAPVPGAAPDGEGEEKKEGPAGYVPPHMRNREGGDSNAEPENATLRVTNVSQVSSIPPPPSPSPSSSSAGTPPLPPPSHFPNLAFVLFRTLPLCCSTRHTTAGMARRRGRTRDCARGGWSRRKAEKERQRERQKEPREPQRERQSERERENQSESKTPRHRE